VITLEHMVLLAHRYKRKNHQIRQKLRHFRLIFLKLFCKSITLSLIIRQQFSHVLSTVCTVSQRICHRSRWLPWRRRRRRRSV